MKRISFFLCISMFVTVGVLLISPTAWSQVITPLPPQPFYKSPIPGLDAFLIEQDDQIQVSGTFTDQSDFIYTVGTSHDSNPAIGLDFYGSGDIDYDYDLTFDLDHYTPQYATAGSSLSIAPYLDFADTQSLATSQTAMFGTDFFFDLHIPLPIIPDIDVNIDIPIPNVSTDAFFVTAEGIGDLNSTDSELINEGMWGNGTGVVQAEEARLDDAWQVGGDLLAAASYAGFTPATVANALGFDLELVLGIDPARDSAVVVSDAQFIMEEVIVEGDVGDIFSYDVETEIFIDLFFTSAFEYYGDIGLYFDGPFFSEQTIFESDFGSWAVQGGAFGSYQFSTTATLYGDVQIVDMDYGGGGSYFDGINSTLGGLTEIFPPTIASVMDEYMPSIQQPPTQMLTYAYDVSDEVFEDHVRSTTAPVPEPATMLLFGTGLVGLAGLGRKKFFKK